MAAGIDIKKIVDENSNNFKKILKIDTMKYFNLTKDKGKNKKSKSFKVLQTIKNYENAIDKMKIDSLTESQFYENVNKQIEKVLTNLETIIKQYNTKDKKDKAKYDALNNIINTISTSIPVLNAAEQKLNGQKNVNSYQKLMETLENAKDELEQIASKYKINDLDKLIQNAIIFCIQKKNLLSNLNNNTAVLIKLVNMKKYYKDLFIIPA